MIVPGIGVAVAGATEVAFGYGVGSVALVTKRAYSPEDVDDIIKNWTDKLYQSGGKRNISSPLPPCCVPL